MQAVGRQALWARRSQRGTQPASKYERDSHSVKGSPTGARPWPPSTPAAQELREASKICPVRVHGVDAVVRLHSDATAIGGPHGPPGDAKRRTGANACMRSDVSASRGQEIDAVAGAHREHGPARDQAGVEASTAASRRSA